MCALVAAAAARAALEATTERRTARSARHLLDLSAKRRLLAGSTFIVHFRTANHRTPPHSRSAGASLRNPRTEMCRFDVEWLEMLF